MRISFSGKAHKSCDLADLRSAMRFFAKELIPEKYLNKIRIHIRFKPVKWYAEMLQNSEYSFTIWIDNKRGYRSATQSLAHEMTHIKQYILGEMRDVGNKTVFKKKKYNIKLNSFLIDREYFNYPWEIEAYGRERGLYVLWQNEKRNCLRRR